MGLGDGRGGGVNEEGSEGERWSEEETDRGTGMKGIVMEKKV